MEITFAQHKNLCLYPQMMLTTVSYYPAGFDVKGNIANSIE